MLFSSQVFIFLFLPLVVFTYYLPIVSKRGERQMFVLLFASLVFYGCWQPRHLPVFIGSMAINYVLIRFVVENKAKLPLIAGIGFNIGLLVFYKYLGSTAGFGFLDGVNRIPLGISFFTFQQIGVLLWVYYRREVPKIGFAQYATFVSFFPQLIAGPICKWEELGVQLREGHKLVPARLLLGVGLFIVGFFKKIVVGDSLGSIADKSYSLLGKGVATTLPDLIGGTSAFSLQIYFDFSGYSEMALGLALIFGLRLPVNFHTPLQAETMGDFWKRWHISLSRFAFETVFLPLAKVIGLKSKKLGKLGSSPLVTYGLPIFATFVVIGVWHGKGWNFFWYGVFHGLLVVFEFLTRGARFWTSPKRVFLILRRCWVFGMLTVSLVIFRLESTAAYAALKSSLLNWRLPEPGVWSMWEWVLILVALAVTQFLPPVHNLFGGEKVAIQTYLGSRSESGDRWFRGGRKILAIVGLAAMYLVSHWFAYDAELRKFIYFDY